MVGPGQETGAGVQPRPEPDAGLRGQPARQPGRDRAVRRLLVVSTCRRRLVRGRSRSGSLYFLLRPDPDAGPAPRPSPTVPVAVPAGGRRRLTARTSGLFPIPDKAEHHVVAVLPDRLRHQEHKDIVTNLISHQVMQSRDKADGGGLRPAVPVPARRAGRTAAAVAGQAGPHHRGRVRQRRGPGAPVVPRRTPRIDAVEIDPVIQQLGGEHHPDRPYQRPAGHGPPERRPQLPPPAPRTASTTWSSSPWSTRWCCTPGTRTCGWRATCSPSEAFRDVRRVLKPTGVCAVYNYFRQGWIAARLRDELRTAVRGRAGRRLTDPPTDTVKLDDFDPDAFTALLRRVARTWSTRCGRRSPTDGNRYWVPGDRRRSRPDTPCRFGPADPLPPPTAAATATECGRRLVRLRSRRSRTPAAPCRRRPTTGRSCTPASRPSRLRRSRGMGLMVVLSVVLWLVYRPRQVGGGARPRRGRTTGC